MYSRYLSFHEENFLKQTKFKKERKSCISQKIYSFLKISKNIGTAYLDRSIKQSRYFRTAIITYRLVNLSKESKLLHDVYICSKNVSNEGKQSWFIFTEKLL